MGGQSLYAYVDGRLYDAVDPTGEFLIVLALMGDAAGAGALPISAFNCCSTGDG